MTLIPRMVMRRNVRNLHFIYSTIPKSVIYEMQISYCFFPEASPDFSVFSTEDYALGKTAALWDKGMDIVRAKNG